MIIATAMRKARALIPERDGAVNRKFTVAGRRITYRHRGPDAFMGRFGGGWQWKIGMQAGPSTVLLNVGMFELTISNPDRRHDRPRRTWRTRRREAMRSLRRRLRVPDRRRPR